jgi:hypothetical protein
MQSTSPQTNTVIIGDKRTLKRESRSRHKDS